MDPQYIMITLHLLMPRQKSIEGELQGALLNRSLWKYSFPILSINAFVAERQLQKLPVVRGLQEAS